MKPRLLRTLMIVALVVLARCATASPTVPPPITPSVLPTATLPPPTETPVSTAKSTATPVPPTETPVSTAAPTDTPVPPTPTPRPPTPTPVSTAAPATDTVCASGCNFTTIQAAIDDAGTTSGAIIEITDPVHTEAGILVNKDITIRGLGASDTIVQAHETPDEAPDRVFFVEEGATVVLERLTIRHGKPSVQEERGGGIMNYGTLTLKNCVVTANIANGGGGICTRGPGELTLINCTVSGNTADGNAPRSFQCGSGGGIVSGGKSLTLINTTVSGNRAGVEKVTNDPRPRSLGGGVHIGCDCTAVFINSTISGNRAYRDGGGISNHGTLQLTNCTISNNTTAGMAGGIYVRGPLDYVNTIIANNNGKEGNCAIDSTFMGTGSIGTNRNNLVEDNTCSPDYSGDPELEPLADNGGDTMTHALLPGSPAIDAISAISCTLPSDQRGAPRPIVRTSPDTPCDIGAFEAQTESWPTD